MPLGSLAPQSAPFAMILWAVMVRLATKLGVSQQYIVPIAGEDGDSWEAVPELEPLFVYVQVFGPQPSDGQGNVLRSPGAPRLAGIALRRIRCYVYTRSGEDVTGADTIALLGQASPPGQTYQGFVMPGQFVAEEVVLNALNDWTPLSGNNNLCLNVLHWVDSAGGPPLRSRPDMGLIRSALDFEVEYVLAINPNDPAP